MIPALLKIEDLKTHFFTYNGVVRAVDGVSLHVSREEILGIVGETGCGKSVTMRSVLRLIPEPGRIVSGRVLLEDTDLLALDDEAMRRVRGGRIAMIFQNPLSSLNPVFTIGEQVCRIIRIHQEADAEAARRQAVEMFSLVRLPNPRRLLRKHPHELSGGQLQRVMIAMALSCRPQLLVADEPTTALDVTIQAQILTLMLKLKRETRTAVVLISHDLGVVAEVCDRVVIMYAGLIVEEAPVQEIFKEPLHPYTRGLIAAIPGQGRPGDELATIAGSVPDLACLPQGCRFHPRCPLSEPVCRRQPPSLSDRGEGRRVACHLN